MGDFAHSSGSKTSRQCDRIQRLVYNPGCFRPGPCGSFALSDTSAEKWAGRFFLPGDFLLPLAADLLRVFTDQLNRHQKSWEMYRPEKITVTFSIGTHSLKPVKKVVVLMTSEVDLREERQ